MNSDVRVAFHVVGILNSLIIRLYGCRLQRSLVRDCIMKNMCYHHWLPSLVILTFSQCHLENLGIDLHL